MKHWFKLSHCCKKLGLVKKSCGDWYLFHIWIMLILNQNEQLKESLYFFLFNYTSVKIRKENKIILESLKCRCMKFKTVEKMKQWRDILSCILLRNIYPVLCNSVIMKCNL